MNDLVLPGGKGNIDHVVMGAQWLVRRRDEKLLDLCSICRRRLVRWAKRISSLSKQAKRNAVALRENLAGVFQNQRTRLPYVV